MIQKRFTAREIVCMAVLCRERSLYGIPDEFRRIPEEQRQREMQWALDRLVDRGVVEMDFDGRVSMNSDYLWLIESICRCERCVTLERREAEVKKEAFIFWRTGDKFLIAELDGETYLFSLADPLIMRGILEECVLTSSVRSLGGEAVVPNTELKKAARFRRQGNYTEAIRILRQNGAEERLVQFILDWTAEKASFVFLRNMEIRDGVCTQNEISYGVAEGLVLSVQKTVVNYATCTVFREVDGETVSVALAAAADAFLGEGKEGESLWQKP